MLVSGEPRYRSKPSKRQTVHGEVQAPHEVCDVLPIRTTGQKSNDDRFKCSFDIIRLQSARSRMHDKETTWTTFTDCSSRIIHGSRWNDHPGNPAARITTSTGSTHRTRVRLSITHI